MNLHHKLRSDEIGLKLEVLHELDQGVAHSDDNLAVDVLDQNAVEGGRQLEQDGPLLSESGGIVEKLDELSRAQLREHKRRIG